jgi:hypothetical protein
MPSFRSATIAVLRQRDIPAVGAEAAPAPAG